MPGWLRCWVSRRPLPLSVHSRRASVPVWCTAFVSSGLPRPASQSAPSAYDCDDVAFAVGPWDSDADFGDRGVRTHLDVDRTPRHRSAVRFAQSQQQSEVDEVDLVTIPAILQPRVDRRGRDPSSNSVRAVRL